MYRRFQSPRQVHHHLWIVLAIISAILLASCSTTQATGVPTPVIPPVSTPTLHPAATSAPLPTPTLSTDRKDRLLDPDGKSQLVGHQE